MAGRITNRATAEEEWANSISHEHLLVIGNTDWAGVVSSWLILALDS